MMPPILKIIFIILGIAPLMRLILTTAVVSFGTAVFLWAIIACGFMEKSSACLVIVYSSFSLLSIAVSRKRTADREINTVQWKLVKNSAVRLVGIAN